MKKSALIPVDVFETAEFRNACMTVTLMSAVFFVTVLYGPQFMEKILGYSALKAGRRECCRCSACSRSRRSSPGRCTGRLGPKVTITAGAARPHRRAIPAVDGRRRLDLQRLDRRVCR